MFISLRSKIKYRRKNKNEITHIYRIRSLKVSLTYILNEQTELCDGFFFSFVPYSQSHTLARDDSFFLRTLLRLKIKVAIQSNFIELHSIAYFHAWLNPAMNKLKREKNKYSCWDRIPLSICIECQTIIAFEMLLFSHYLIGFDSDAPTYRMMALFRSPVPFSSSNELFIFSSHLLD